MKRIRYWLAWQILTSQHWITLLIITVNHTLLLPAWWLIRNEQDMLQMQHDAFKKWEAKQYHTLQSGAAK